MMAGGKQSPVQPPSARRAIGGAFHRGSFVILGGFGVRGTTAPDDIGADLWRYRDGWSLIRDGATSPARYPSLCSTEEGLWRFGGCGFHDGRQVFLDELWRYRSDWEEVKVAGPRPIGRYTSALAAWRGALFMFGGCSRDLGGAPVFHGDLWCFAGDRWEKLGDEETGPGKRYGFGWTVSGSRLFIFGGFDGHSDCGDFWALDLESLQWERLSEGPPARYCPALGAVGRSVVLFGGRSKTDPRLNFSDTWVYEDNGWRRTAEGKPAYHAKPGYASDGSSLWLFGGEGPTGHLSDLWRFGENGWQLLEACRDDDPVLW